MNVQLLNFTPNALELLLRTKNTRLSHTQDPATMTEQEKADHLDYMRDTIRSSWEFVDYVFSIEGVTRAFTHQLVRTRTGSYAQESMRAVDARDHAVEMPATVARDDVVTDEWRGAECSAFIAYERMVDAGIPLQDARGILPIATKTNIICKFDLRTLSHMAEVRLCTRTQGEYQDVFSAMKDCVVAVHPWAEPFIRVHCAAHGTCCFPRYKGCPLQELCVPPSAQKDAAAKVQAALADGMRHEANPVASGGKTQ